MILILNLNLHRPDDQEDDGDSYRDLLEEIARTRADHRPDHSDSWADYMRQQQETPRPISEYVTPYGMRRRQTAKEMADHLRDMRIYSYHHAMTVQHEKAKTVLGVAAVKPNTIVDPFLGDLGNTVALVLNGIDGMQTYFHLPVEQAKALVNRLGDAITAAERSTTRQDGPGRAD